MKRKSMVIVGAVLGVLIGFPVGAIWGWGSSRPFHFGMETTPRQPAPYDQFLNDIAKQFKTDRGNAGTLVGIAIGVPTGAIVGALLGATIFILMHSKTRPDSPEVT
jgi:hypothetical protein